MKTSPTAEKLLSNPLSLKIAYIGGGSRYWAKMVMTDLALCPDFKGEIALYDIDHKASQLNVKSGTDIFTHPQARSRFKVRAYSKSADALKGADFVFMSILPGPMWMMANDIDIPAKYGVFQTVGDTTGPGGISRAMRSIPVYADYAHQIMKHCPKAWVINYTNPMTLCTRALYAAEPSIKAIGCCHEVFGLQEQLAQWVSQSFGVPVPKRTEIHTDVIGVNHFTFITKALWKGQDLFPMVKKVAAQKEIWKDQTAFALERIEKGQWCESKKLVALDFFRKYGVLGAAGDRHLVEFVPWYLESVETLHRYGVVLTPSSFRLGTWQPPQNAPGADVAKEKSKSKQSELKASGEEGTDILQALVGIRPLHTNINFPNRGQMPNTLPDAVVETNALFQYDQVLPTVPEPLPSGVETLVNRVIDVQELTLRAAMEGREDLALQALLSDPLCGIPVERVEKMWKELCQANASKRK
jgi:alpha-galactosidase